MKAEELTKLLIDERVELEETAVGRELTPTEFARLENIKTRIAQIEDGNFDPEATVEG